VGVLFDYFRAPDASTAAAVLERVGGPMAGPDAPVLDAVDGKGFEPAVMMRKLQALLTGVPYDDLPEGELEGTEAAMWCQAVRRISAPAWSQDSSSLNSCRAMKRFKHRRISRVVLPSAVRRAA